MNIQLLKDLCSVYGPTSYEETVAEFILNDIKDYIDDFKFDRLGNLIVHKKGQGRKMMLAGHMDQFGLLVTDINKDGFLYFAPLGGISPENLITQRVIFKNGIIGIVNCERIGNNFKMTLDKMYIDIGARNKDDAEKYVSVGDVCVFHTIPLIDNNKIISPALDDRSGCFIMMEALKRIKNSAFDLYFAFTVQKEVGTKTSAYSVEPDYGIVFDVTASFDTPKAKKLPSKMYGGAAIKLKDSSFLCHPTMVKHFEKCAKEANINYQFEILETGDMHSDAIHISYGDVPSGVISIPARNLHSASEMCALSDISDCIELAVKVLEMEIS